jgi:phosphoglucosamine mutase
MSELLSQVALFPQVLINVRLQAGQDWQNNPKLQAATKEVQAQLGQTGRVLIRASGTEPLVRVMVEAQDEQVARELAEKIAETLKP